MLREYLQGPNAFSMSVPGGGFDARKHASLEQAARDELLEETGLSGGRWFPLLGGGGEGAASGGAAEGPGGGGAAREGGAGGTGIQELKWSLNRMHPFLVIDPQQDGRGPSLDDEELITTRRVSVQALEEAMYGGEMPLPAFTACAYALRRLRQLGLLP